MHYKFFRILFHRTQFLCVVFLSLLIFCTSSLKATTIEVCSNCTTKNVKEGLDKCSPYDTLRIKAGTYQVENLVIDIPLVIYGEDYPVLVSKSGDEVITVLADSVSIVGLHIRDVKASYLVESAAIKLKNCKAFFVINNKVTDCFFGIYLEHVKKGVIQGNEVHGPGILDEASSGNAIHAWYCESLLVSKNNLSGHRDGIYLEFVNHSMVSSNKSFENNRYGLHFMFSNDDEYFNNTFQNNGVGVAVMFSRRIKMHNNNFLENWGISSYGLLLKEINDALITGNDFHRNTIGIFVEGSNRINYIKNNFNRNGYAIQFSGGCMTNNITSNNFTNNSIDLIVKSDINNNVIDHNYWNEYTGYDLNKDNIGDVPYYPIKLFSYIVEKVPESIILMRSMFVDLINFSEKVSPIFTPKNVMDLHPLMQPVKADD